jgi:hypothetical protein
MQRRAAILLIALLCLLGAASPARALVKVRIQSYGVALDAAAVRDITLNVGDIQKVCEEILGVGHRWNQAVDLKVFEHRADFLAYAGAAGLDNIKTIGFHRTRPMEVAVWRQGDPEKMLSTLRHESLHLFLSLGSRRPPIWLNEGLAGVLEYARLEGSRFVVPPHPVHEQNLRAMLQNRALPSLAAFLNIPTAEWQRLDTRGAPVRSLSWGLAYLLLESDEGRRQASLLLTAMSRTNAPCSVVLDQARFGGVSGLERDFHAWIARPHDPLSLDITSPAQPSEGTYVRP